MKTLILFLAAAFAAFAQAPADPRFSATTGDVSLTAQTTALTVQATANSKQWTGESASAYCSVACNITIKINGAAATATAGAFVNTTPTDTRGATATVWTASNVGSGTTIGGIIHVQAGQTLTIDISKIAIGGGSTALNLTFSVGSITGTANLTVIGTEKQ